MYVFFPVPVIPPDKVDDAAKYITDQMEKELHEPLVKSVTAAWNYNVDVTDANEIAMVYFNRQIYQHEISLTKTCSLRIMPQLTLVLNTMNIGITEFDLLNMNP